MPARGSRKTANRRADGRPRSRDGEATARSLAERVRQIAFILVLFAATWGPFVPTLENNFVARLIVQTLFVLAAALWVMSMALEGRVCLRRTGVLPWLAVLAGALASGVVNAAYKYPAALTAFSWLSAMAAFLFVVNEARGRRARLLLLAAMGASAFCVALHGLPCDAPVLAQVRVRRGSPVRRPPFGRLHLKYRCLRAGTAAQCRVDSTLVWSS